VASTAFSCKKLFDKLMHGYEAART
jgi:hypothetical protein